MSFNNNKNLQSNIPGTSGLSGNSNLTSGTQGLSSNLNQGGFGTQGSNLGTGFTGSNLGTGFTGSNLNQGTTGGLSSGLSGMVHDAANLVTGGSNLTGGTSGFSSNLNQGGLGTQGSNLGTGFTGSNLGTGFTGSTFGQDTTGTFVCQHGTTFGTSGMSTGTTQAEPEKKGFVSNLVSHIPIIGKHGHHETQETGMVGGTQPEKKGFVSNLMSHVPIIGHKDKTAETTEMGGIQRGYLDEKGTTEAVHPGFISTGTTGFPTQSGIVPGLSSTGLGTGMTSGLGTGYGTSMTSGFGTSNLGTGIGLTDEVGKLGATHGLPVTGPDVTHGTHGRSHETVLTGGPEALHPSEKLFGTQLPVTSEVGNPVGVNATHGVVDLTLQDGGLLGLRQGAVTGNPGDIISNYDPGHIDKTATLGTGLGTGMGMGTSGTVIDKEITVQPLGGVGTTGVTGSTFGTSNIGTTGFSGTNQNLPKKF